MASRAEGVWLFVKLPGWLKVPTPAGQYNPDWALVMENARKHGSVLYLDPRNQKHLDC